MESLNEKHIVRLAKKRARVHWIQFGTMEGAKSEDETSLNLASWGMKYYTQLSLELSFLY